MYSSQAAAARLIRDEFRIRHGIDLTEQRGRDLALIACDIERATAAALDALTLDDQPQDLARITAVLADAGGS